jgi:hypothetical protein
MSPCRNCLERPATTYVEGYECCEDCETLAYTKGRRR